MRWYIIFKIFLTLSINDFALAVPVLVQEKRHACVDAVHVPKDVVTVLEKRGGDDVKLLGEFIDFFKPADGHAPSSSAPPGPSHGSKIDVPAPAPNLASPAVNPAPLMDPLSLSLGLSSTGSSMKGVADNLNTGQKLVKSPKPPSLPPPAPMRDAGLQEKWWYDGQDGPMYTPVSLSGPDRELTGVHALQPPPLKRPRPGLGSKLNVPAPASNLASPTVNLAPLMEPPSVSTASRMGMGEFFSHRMNYLAGETNLGPPRRASKRKRPIPKNPGLPTVPEQEVGTAPLPNPSSPID